MNLTITGYSTALYSTWYFVEELNILFDCGDGASAGLLGKSGKVKQLFISHADRDHLTGLLQFNQLNAKNDLPHIYYPKDCGSFPALQEFCGKFDQHTGKMNWEQLVHDSKIVVNKNIHVRAIRNEHVTCPRDISKSLSYKIVDVKHKLKKELLKLNQDDLKKIISEQGKEATHDQINTDILYYSGDTPCENFEDWKNSEILIHEATFLGQNEDIKIKTHGNKHTRLDEVLKAVSVSNVKKLILGHFSSRYNNETIITAISDLCKDFNVEIPVFAVLPGETKRDILKLTPVFQP